MIKKYNVIGFIPARSGSTRFKNKNIKLIDGKPLIYWSVIKAIKSKKFDKIIFSSNSAEYFTILLKFLNKDKIDHKNLFFDKRSSSHSKTKSKIFDYIKYDFIKKFNLKKDDLLVQLLPTSPMRKIKTIKNVISLALKKEKNIFSVSEYNFHVSFAMSINGLNWKPLFKKSPLKNGDTQSQRQIKYFHPNGVINCLFIKYLKKKNNSIYQKAIPYIVSKVESLDLDTKEDFEIIKILTENNISNFS